ncbi:MAG: chorismate synthase [candidate division Zixibacteria bacterium]|nr:chorismate synthase [candidate division Zixibacteria bacterium]
MLRFLTAGESHGPQLTVVLDGFPAGVAIDPEKINFQLARRQKGYGRGGRMQIEQDRVEIVSGVRLGISTGGPITLVIKNKDWANWSDIMSANPPDGKDASLESKIAARRVTSPRPGHADLVGGIKYRHHDLRNVLERASARETTARTAVGALVRQLLEHFDVEFGSHAVRIGQVALLDYKLPSDLSQLREVTEASEVRCIDKDTEAKMIAEIERARMAGDSVGGEVEIIVRRLPVGLGSYAQWSDRFDSRLAAALMSIPSVKGVEIGLGFAAAEQYGSQVHDEIVYTPGRERRKKGYGRSSNNAGGIEGGITNGEDVVARVASKPLATLNRPLQTVDIISKQTASAAVERTDNCVVPALAVICEAMAALVAADAFLAKFGGDSMEEIRRNYNSFLDDPY